MKTFCMGDIHGSYKALLQCLKLSNFDRKHDRLICLGDVCDRGAQVKECIDELLTISHCIFILGNHDAWALQWGMEGIILEEWWSQTGDKTVNSYGHAGMPKAHIQFLAQAPLYYVDRNRLFVHGGFDPDLALEETPKEIFLWDRSLLKRAREMNATHPEYKFGPYEEVFLGHSPTSNFGDATPQKFCNIWDLDTGAGWGKKLTIMDIETKEYWQSEVS